MLRLRQICLVATDLAKVRDDLTSVFDLAVCYVDRHVEPFGLHNSIIPVGTSFLEIVAPVRASTAAARYLDRRGGDGGYMTILNSDEIDSWRKHIAELGMREAVFLDYDGLNCIQIDPRDTGGSMLEINRTLNGESVTGPYVPAGPNWRDYIRTSRVSGIVAAELQSDDPEKLASRWAAILKRNTLKAGPREWHIRLDTAVLRFVPAKDGRGEGLGGVDIAATDIPAILHAAHKRRLSVANQTVVIGGLRFNLVETAQQWSSEA